MRHQDSVPFSYAEIGPYAVAEALDELRGPVHGVITLPPKLAWGGRTRFDLDESYDRTALYKTVLEEGRVEDFRRLLNGGLLKRIWREILPVRQVRAAWERRFPELRQAA